MDRLYNTQKLPMNSLLTLLVIAAIVLYVMDTTHPDLRAFHKSTLSVTTRVKLVCHVITHTIHYYLMHLKSVQHVTRK